jgi:23S rRNA (cytidine1920-2'-O)/16S rRNA (cytidine1409-2'-O)-methyltransferase
VTVGGQVATKPATAVVAGAALLVAEEPGEQWVSRGAHKLLGALDAFGYDPTGKRCLDAGASTGGFTDVLLRRGAAHVVAVDVGYGLLAWSLRTDPRVTVVERVNARALEPAQIGEPVDLVVADLSFIPLGLVLPALVRCARPDADLMPMVKPQFEVGKEKLPSGGVVRDPGDRASAVRRVAEQAAELGLGVAGVVASPLPGPSGNVEYFLWLRRGAPSLDEDALRRAVEDGPQ